jgi:ribosomal protein S18 acetylase RimI-like enzyme
MATSWNLVSNGIRYRLAMPQDEQAIAKLMSHEFRTAEPLTKHLQIPEIPYDRFVDCVCKHCCANGLSMVAEEVETNRLLGALLSKDYISPLGGVDGPPLEHEGLEHIVNLLHEVVVFFDERFPETKSGETIEFFMIAVDSSCGQRGIGAGLLSNAVQYYQEHNAEVQHLVAEGTSYFSTKLFKKYGFESLGEIAYDNFKPNGQEIFKGLDPIHSKVSMLYRPLR